MPIWKDQKAGPPVAGRRCYPCKSCDSAYIEYKGKLRSHRTISMAPGLFRVCSYMAVLHDVQFHAGILDQVDPALGDIGVGDDDINREGRIFPNLEESINRMLVTAERRAACLVAISYWSIQVTAPLALMPAAEQNTLLAQILEMSATFSGLSNIWVFS